MQLLIRRNKINYVPLRDVSVATTIYKKKFCARLDNSSCLTSTKVKIGPRNPEKKRSCGEWPPEQMSSFACACAQLQVRPAAAMFIQRTTVHYPHDNIGRWTASRSYPTIRTRDLICEHSRVHATQVRERRKTGSRDGDRRWRFRGWLNGRNWTKPWALSRKTKTFFPETALS